MDEDTGTLKIRLNRTTADSEVSVDGKTLDGVVAVHVYLDCRGAYPVAMADLTVELVDFEGDLLTTEVQHHTVKVEKFSEMLAAAD